MAKRPFNGSPTVDGYYTTFDSSEVHRVEESGGDTPSGSSDFSTATVTIAGNTGMLTLPIAMEADAEYGAPAFLSVIAQAIESGTYKVPLYKGGLVIDLPSGTSVSGQIEYIGMGYYITGDCTITIG